MDRARTAVFSYCATFLPKEMLHVYRQVSGLRRFENHVLTRTRVNADQFPYSPIHTLTKSPLRFLTRLAYRVQRNAVPVSRFEVNQMLRLVNEHGGRLTHVYLGTEALRVLALLRDVKTARIVSFHGADLAHAQSAARYEQLWPLVELVLCRSKSLRDELIAKGCSQKKIRLNYTGVPVPAKAPLRAAPMQSSTRPLRLLQACRLIEKKGLEITLQAAAHLDAKGIPAQLTFAGDGPLRAALENEADRLGIRKLVTFAGFVKGSDLQRLYHESDLFVHPSRGTGTGDREGIPNSLLEAMAAGLPVIATRHSGIPEAIEDGASGILIHSAEPESLAAAIERLSSSADLYNRLSLGGWQRVNEHFSIERCVSNLESLYDEAIELARTF